MLFRQTPLIKHARRAGAALLMALAPACACADEYVVGILSPLTGDWAGLGQTIRNGITLALEQAEDRGLFREGVRLSLKNYDDNIAPEMLGPRMEKFVRENDAILLIGPIFSPQAEAVATTANRFAFPILSPAVSEGVTASGSWAFRSSVSPHRLIEEMAGSVIDTLRARKVAVVYAAGNAGFESQAHAVAQVGIKMGKLIVGEIAVGEEERVFVETAASLKSVAPDIVFVLMDAEPAGVFASRLRRAGVPPATRLVFGPAAAAPALLQVGREYVENAIVATDYLPELPGIQNQAFVAAYQGRYGKRPDRYAGIGYATGMIAAEAVRNAGPAPTRALMREALERGTSLTLPLGQSKWTMGARHEPQYAPALFNIRGGRFVPLEAQRGPATDR